MNNRFSWQLTDIEITVEKHLPGIHNQQSHAGSHVASKVTLADIEHDQAISKRLHDEDLDLFTEQDKIVRYVHLIVDEDYVPEAGGENTEQRLLIDIFGEEHANKLQKQQEDAEKEAQADWDKESGPKKLLTRDEELAELENSPAVKHMYQWQSKFEDAVANAPRYYRGVDYEHVKKFLRASEIEPLGDQFAGGLDVSMTIDPDVTSVFGDYMLIIDGPMARQHGAEAFDYTDENILYNDERGWEAEEQEVVSDRPIPKEAVIGIMTPGGDILSLNKGVQKHLPGIHDQMKHAGDRGSSKNIVTFTPTWDLVTEEAYPGPVPIYQLKNWDDLPNFDKGTYTFTVDRFSNEIIAAPTSRIVHEEMLTHAVPDKSIDDVVRFRIRSGRIEVSTYNAGIEIRSAEDEILAFDEIYKALDKIVAIGIPKTYPVSIRTEYGNERYHVISLKSLVEKHLPGVHNQQNHAGVNLPKLIKQEPKPGHMLVFHGSTDNVIDSVMQDGLLPGGGKDKHWYSESHRTQARKKSVFVTDDLQEAVLYGITHGDVEIRDAGIRPIDYGNYDVVVFEAEVPEGELTTDYEDIGRGYKHFGPIKPEYITGYAVYTVKLGKANIGELLKEGATPTRIFRKSGGKVRYIPIIVLKSVEKHLPGQHNQDKHAGRRSLEVRTTRGNSIKEAGLGEGADLSDYFFIRRTSATPADIISTLSGNFIANGIKFEYQESDLPNKSGIRFTNLVDGYKSSWLKIDKDSKPIRVLAAANDLLRAAGIGTLKVVIDTEDPHEFMVSLKYDSDLDVVPLQEDADLWHGTTTEKYEKKIKEEGLRGRTKFDDSLADVFLTPNKLVAGRYAHDRAAMEESKPALLRVHLPKGAELGIDDSEFQAYTSADVPPERITLQKHLPAKALVDRYSKGQ